MLAVPVVLSELGWMAQGVVDTIMVGRLGPAAIGAVAVGNAVFYTPSLFGIGLLLGLDTAGSPGLRAQRLRRLPSLAGAGHLSRRRHRARHHDAHCVRQLRLCPRRHRAGGRSPRRRLPSHPRLEHSSAPHLRSIAPLPARRRPGPRHHRHLHRRQPAQLARELGAHLRPLGLPAMGVTGSALSTVLARILMALALRWLCLALRAPARPSALPALGRPSLAKLKQLMPPRAARRGPDRLSKWAHGTSPRFPPAGSRPSRWPPTRSPSTTPASPNGAARHLGSRRRQLSATPSAQATSPRPSRRLARARPRHRLHALRRHRLPGRARARSSPSSRTIPRSWPSAPACSGSPPPSRSSTAFRPSRTGALRGLGETRAPMIANFVGYWILGLPARPDPLLHPQVGHLRHVDRSDSGPRNYLDHATISLEERFPANFSRQLTSKCHPPHTA